MPEVQIRRLWKGMVINMKTEKEVLTLIIRYIRKHIKFIALALSAGAMCAVCSVAGSELLKRVVDGLEAGKLTDIGRIILMCAGILAAGASSAYSSSDEQSTTTSAPLARAASTPSSTVSKPRLSMIS